MRYFSRRYRCVTCGARRYPPSDVPPDVASYSMARAVADAVFDHLHRFRGRLAADEARIG